MSNEVGHKRVYLDTSYLYELVMKRHTQKSDDVARVVEKSIYNAQNYHYQIVIPQIAVGEVFATLPEDIVGQQELVSVLNVLWTTLEDLLGKDFNGLLPMTGEGIEILKCIKEYEDRLDPTDTIIIAQAASDPSSETLLTLDKAIINSTGLRKFVQELVKKGKRKTSLTFREHL